MRRLGLTIALAAACSSDNRSNLSPTRVIDPEAIRRACAMEVSCFASPPPLASGGSCVKSFEVGLATGSGILFGPSAEDIQRYVDCAADSSTCTSALECASHHHGTDWCNAHQNGGCDGDTLIFCIDNWGLEQIDCGALGQHCGTANGFSTCTDGSNCDPNRPNHCEGNVFVQCEPAAGLEARWDCAQLAPGTLCQSLTSSNGSTESGCLPAPSANCPKDAVRCQGSTGVVCSNGVERRTDCAQFANHCVLNSMGDNFTCEPDAINCSDSSPDTCLGDSLQICVNGAYVATTCSSIGLNSCQDGRCQ